MTCWFTFYVFPPLIEEASDYTRNGRITHAHLVHTWRMLIWQSDCFFEPKWNSRPCAAALMKLCWCEHRQSFKWKKTPYRMHAIWTLHFRIFKIYVHFSASDRWRFPKDSQHGSSTCSQYEGEQKAKEGNWGWRASRKVNAWVVVFPFWFFFGGEGWGRLSWWFHYNNKQPMKGEFYSRFLFADWTRQLKLFTLAFVLTTSEGNFKAKMARSHFSVSDESTEPKREKTRGYKWYLFIVGSPSGSERLLIKE